MTTTVTSKPVNGSPTTAEDRHEHSEDRPLRISEEGLALLRERLCAANADNPAFAAQAEELFAVVRPALDDLRRHFSDQIERVLAVGTWALRGIDLRTLPDDEDVVLEIVIRAEDRDFGFETGLAERMFAHTHNGHFLLQISMLPLPLWNRSLTFVEARGTGEGVLGIPLLVRE